MLLLATIISGFVSILLVYAIFKLFKFRAPLVPTSRKIAKKMVEIAEISSKKRVVDLGCGIGTILFVAEQIAPKNNFSGFEVLRPAVWFSRARAKLARSKIQFHCKDFFEADLSNSDVIFCYLWPSVMNRFYEKIYEKLKPGTKIVSHAFKIPKLEPIKIERVGRATIFLYKK